MQVHLTADDRASLRTFWRFYEPRHRAILETTREAMKRSAHWSRLAASAPADELAREDRDFHVLQAGAILEDRWEPLVAQLRVRGERYALAGFSYAAWFEILGYYRDTTRDQLSVLLKEDRERHHVAVFDIARGLNRFIDVIAGEIGEAYLEMKQRVIALGEDRYRSIFEHSPQPMWMLEREAHRIVAVNQAAIDHYGYSRDEFLALPDSIAIEAEALAQAGTWKHRKRDGAVITVDMRTSDFTVDGRPVRLVHVNDVTERVQAQDALRKTEDQLRHAQKMEAIGRLAGGVAHDFNNVLTVVSSYACMLEETLEPSDTRHRDAVEIRRATERASAITRQLLTLSRHSIVAPRSIDVDELITAFRPMLMRLVGDGVAVALHCGSSKPVVTIDPGQLEQVLMNLALNARDAMPGGGRLLIGTRVFEVGDETAVIETRRPGRYVEIAVTDTGTGIDAETRGRMFEPFFTTKGLGKGTGLGLAIVHGIVAQAGGDIGVYSEPGLGTTFRVNLPLSADSAPVAEPEHVPAPRTLPALRILVVDDQPGVRAVATRILNDAGCHVLEAASAHEARRICVHHEEAIDLALLDVVLPDGRGGDLIAQLRDLRPQMKFVQMSGYPAGALSATGAAPSALLEKPFSPAELRAAVARACGTTTAVTVRSADDTPSEPRATRRALVADDDDLVRRTVVRMLRKADFEVVEVDTGFKAIAALEGEPFDVVVSDVQMPDGGGLDLLRAVRRVDLDVPVILMTGEPALAAAAEAVEYGAFRYLTKPLDSLAFVKTVEHAARAYALARLRRDAFNVSGAHAGAADRAGLEVRFEQAVAGMWMAFQPIVYAGSGMLFGVEALMRTTEPSMPNPGALLDAATQLDRLPLIGRRVRALAASAFAPRLDDVALFVNLHPEDLEDADLVDAMAPLTAIASRVVLEITERASLESSTELSERIKRLRKLGFRLAVDDIGAGYSGLTSFTELTPEIVKIDMSLVRDVHTSTLKRRTIGALCRLCHEVGTLVVGEGVETIEERDALIDVGCDLLQGYLLGKPKRELP